MKQTTMYLQLIRGDLTLWPSEAEIHLYLPVTSCSYRKPPQLSISRQGWLVPTMGVTPNGIQWNYEHIYPVSDELWEKTLAYQLTKQL